MFDLSNKPRNYNKLFFGDYGNVARIDIGGDSQFKKLAELSEANSWFLNVINCTHDRWHELAPNSLSKHRKNIAYQTAMDSLVPSVFSYLSELATDPWLSYLYARINTEEHIHSMSYSSGISQAFGARAEEFLDIIYTDPHIAARVATEISIHNRFLLAYQSGFSPTDHNKMLLLELLGTTFCLEGIKFPFSFFTTWSINKAEQNRIQGFSQLISLIAYDEMTVHTTTGASLLRKLSKSPDFKHLFDSGWFASMMTALIEKTVSSELEWVDYLLEDGELLGFTRPVCEHFIKYWADRRLDELKLPTIYGVVRNDIIDWFNAYRDPNSKQAALQEIDNTSYQLGQLVNDLHKFDTKPHH